MSTAFGWVHASWDNAEGVVSRGSRIGRRGGTEPSAL